MNPELSTNDSTEDDSLPVTLAPQSYTAQRLKHATPDHLHLTSRRRFIGPLPDGWLKSHRDRWYKDQLNYSSRAATFTSSQSLSQSRQITGLGGPSASARYTVSFPQPDDINSDGDDADDDPSPQISKSSESGPSDVPTIPKSGNISPVGFPEPGDSDAGGNSSEVEVSANRKVPQPNSSKPSEIIGSSKPSYGASSSFVTAREFQSPPGPNESGKPGVDDNIDTDQPNEKSIRKRNSGLAHHLKLDSVLEGNEMWSGSGLSEESSPAEPSNSMSSLIHHTQQDDTSMSMGRTHLKDKLQSNGERIEPIDSVTRMNPELGNEPRQDQKVGLMPANLVRFDVADDSSDKSKKRTRLSRLNQGRPLRRFIPDRSSQAGEIIKVEKMLVRIDYTAQQLPEEYDENESLKVVTRPMEQWCEFVVVCRQSSQSEVGLSLELYKSRVIPAIQVTSVKKRASHEIILTRSDAHINLYSSLDKTLVIWIASKDGFILYTMRPHSSASSVEWYTFIRTALGWGRPQTLQVHIPDLGVCLLLDDPFRKLEAVRENTQSLDEVVVQTMVEEQAVASSIIANCLTKLGENVEWANILESWKKSERMGLAWTRYDRLEWIHGASEQKLYGTIAMEKSHNLELRPKLHYSTCVTTNNGSSILEPIPIEGFLIRLTSLKGRNQRFGRNFYKRLYYSTHNQFLCYCRPARGLPPPPPRLSFGNGSRPPSSRHITNDIPVIYDVDPYPLDEDKEISWMRSNNQATLEKYDREAYTETERRVSTLLQADGHINLCDVIKVREMLQSNAPAEDSNSDDDGDDIDFHEGVLHSIHEDGRVSNVDNDRTFELLLKNGLVVRLQAFNRATKNEWVNRLRKLVIYWKLRISAEAELSKIVRNTNLEKLHIYEEEEAFIGQFASKWEVSQSVASSQLYNMCHISCCRSISISGVLYQKPKRHATFKRYWVILSQGRLLIFENSLRKLTGEEVDHIQNEKHSSVDLKECYIYSGLITEGELLYQNQTVDASHPGHHALPRIYMEDGWTSSDEDTMTSFVIWHGTRKSLFRASEESRSGRNKQRLKRVSQLGVTGRSIVFRARSRAERDHWVMSISTEIERLQEPEEFRFVSK
ncbi:MAG: hypothetical protein M1829_000791 [Trizodia sp. TS-e1964]|nr:MAG: hypothetical protein M1829_000791 [Trizodia sp. TS-e1964]